MKLVRKPVEVAQPEKDKPDGIIAEALAQVAKANFLALTDLTQTNKDVVRALSDIPPRPTSFFVYNLVRDTEDRIVSFEIEVK